MENLSKISKISIIDEVVKRVRASIVSGGYKVGDKLPTESQICEQLGVGRSTVREGFRVLEALGLIEMHYGRGAFVKRTSDDSYEAIREWFIEKEDEISRFIEVRMAIEPLAVRLAVQRGTKSQIKQIELIHERFALAAKRSDPIELGTLDESFHNAIIEASHNRLLMKIGRLLADALVEYRARTFTVTENIVHALIPHQQIVDALRRRDERAAVEGMQHHMEEALIDLQNLAKETKH
jgi:GntR family transcriptional repressor for pyruvate dehydrogenase complex